MECSFPPIDPTPLSASQTRAYLLDTLNEFGLSSEKKDEIMTMYDNGALVESNRDGCMHTIVVTLRREYRL